MSRIQVFFTDRISTLGLGFFSISDLDPDHVKPDPGQGHLTSNLDPGHLKPVPAPGHIQPDPDPGHLQPDPQP